MVSLSASPCSGGGSTCVTASLFLAHTHIHTLALTQARSGTLVQACLPEPTEKQLSPSPSLSLVYLYLSFLQFRFPERRKASAWLREAKGAHMITTPFSPLHSRRAWSIERKQKLSPSAGSEPRGGQVRAHIPLHTVTEDVVYLINRSHSLCFCFPSIYFFFYLLPSFLPLWLWLTPSERNQYIFHSQGSQLPSPDGYHGNTGLIEWTESLFICTGPNRDYAGEGWHDKASAWTKTSTCTHFFLLFSSGKRVVKQRARDIGFTNHTAANPHCWALKPQHVAKHVTQFKLHPFRTFRCPKPLPSAVWVGCLYLSTVLGLGHSHQELKNRLRLRHQRGDSMDDSSELGVHFDPWGGGKKKIRETQEDRLIHSPYPLESAAWFYIVGIFYRRPL